ncbi:tRNA (adenosine(37)-N6)-threonylcarbamoyltransferase complex dimerization subunit type 1 TsaB [Buchnera aphidicola]|uniref:tRNA (adenosine(37)-N6)-threonylcarbamoyltransferase complex dimerization subunit type 1 TsaB n=1 Tax=Buchnera aphidicola TaxID=9 RepID=UPI0022390C93|nr:tRNA (adenosine(37)-N6)-threonylcarbamoyltransferase complex dimerization subunit type 1 TsaB [Buchnera aphidicola]MCW5197722.1 tRNA (adenosine(37)-N6)-threonylcarbamoyltransferase complex dimerization subunit type 1 TsaB [Buchnera aphidicola (Chaitophorus viminalis)]
MKLLTLDSSSNYCSVALKNKSNISCINKLTSNHTDIIFMIKKILSKNYLLLSDIDYIACSNGPGSFTGIRIAINISQGFNIGLNIPIIGISTLKILSEHARNQTNKKNFIAIIQANKKNVYWGKYIFYKKKWYLKNKELYIPNTIALNKIFKLNKIWKIIGILNNFLLYKKSIYMKSLNLYKPSALDIIPLAIQYINEKKKYSFKKIFPNYLNKIIK